MTYQQTLPGLGFALYFRYFVNAGSSDSQPCRAATCLRRTVSFHHDFLGDERDMSNEIRKMIGVESSNILQTSKRHNSSQQ